MSVSCTRTRRCVFNFLQYICRKPASRYLVHREIYSVGGELGSVHIRACQCPRGCRRKLGGAEGRGGRNWVPAGPHWVSASTDDHLGVLATLPLPLHLVRIHCQPGCRSGRDFVTALNLVCLPAGSVELGGFVKAGRKSPHRGVNTCPPSRNSSLGQTLNGKAAGSSLTILQGSPVTLLPLSPPPPPTSR